MYEIRKIKSLCMNDVIDFGFNGFRTNAIYEVERKSNENNFSVQLEEIELSETYIKKWNMTTESLETFANVIEQGYSLAIYNNDKIIGFCLLSFHGWNNSMWIENIRISEKHMRKGIGQKLIASSIEIAHNKSARILGLEVQNTNYPAIQFYKKCGFQISGIDFSRYPQKEGDIEQIAIIMSKEID